MVCTTHTIIHSSDWIRLDSIRFSNGRHFPYYADDHVEVRLGSVECVWASHYYEMTAGIVMVITFCAAGRCSITWLPECRLTPRMSSR